MTNRCMVNYFYICYGNHHYMLKMCAEIYILQIMFIFVLSTIHIFVICCLLSEKMCSLMMAEWLQPKHVGERKISVQ
jgi:hypothetical protein